MIVEADMMVWITLSHSSRPLDFSRSSRAALNSRFGNIGRLDSLPSFVELDESNSPHWANNITVWTWRAPSELKLISFIKRNHTVNHALIEGQFEQLVICADDRLEVCSLDGKPNRTTTHPWFAGGHTVYRNECGNYVVACSASDAVITVDCSTLNIVKTWRMPPALYGSNYELRVEDDVRRHYIKNDYQISHLNSAFPSGDEVLLTCFIQGAIVRVDLRGICEEIVTGFVGCHGGRRAGDGRIYFADSTRGEIVWIDPDGSVSDTMPLSSAWLHDVAWLFKDYYVCSVGDRNELAIVDARTREMLHVENLSEFGATPCLLSSGLL